MSQTGCTEIGATLVIYQKRVMGMSAVNAAGMLCKFFQEHLLRSRFRGE
jgi:hypothetical protein